MKTKILFLFLVVLSFGEMFSQTSSPTPEVVISDQIAPVCNPGDCVELTASYTQVETTTNYTVQSIPYAPAAAFTALSDSNTMDVSQDDTWSPIFNLPFDFCFYGQYYDKVLVGSNGVITFDIAGIVPGGTQNPGGGCDYTVTGGPIPSASFVIKNAVYGVYQDTNIGSPPVTNPAIQNVNYRIYGSYPQRMFVVNFNELPQFSCNTSVGFQTSQIVLYETTNVIEVHVMKRTPCNGWISGRGVIGIQNQAGTLAHVPTGRNVGAWSTTNEAWRFTPDGNVTTSHISWLANGVLISGSEDVNPITVCPTENTVYTAVVNYTQCDNSLKTISASKNVGPEEFPLTNEPQDIPICTAAAPPYIVDLNQDAYMLGSIDPGGYMITYYNDLMSAENGTPSIDPSVLSMYETNGNETIYVRIDDFFTNFCATFAAFDIVVQTPPSGSISYAGVEACNTDTTVLTPTNTTPGNGYYVVTPDTGLIFDTSTGIITPEGSQLGSYDIYYHIDASGDCPAYDTPVFTLSINECCKLDLISAVGTDNQTICIGDAIVTVEYETNEDVTGVNVQNLPSGLSYTFINNTVTITGTPDTTVADTFTISITTIGCVNELTKEVTIVVDTPVLVITDPAAVCAPNTVDITAPSIIAGSTGLGTMTYYEADGITEITDPTSISVSDTYYIKTVAGSCEAIEPVTVTIHTSPVLTITNPSAVCVPTTVDITDPAIIVGSTDLGTMTYYESDGVTVVGDPTAISTSGIYYIKTTTIDGCSDIQQVEVTINATPVLVITDPAAVCAPNTVDITAPSIIAGSTGLGTMTYYEVDGVTEITDPTLISVSGTYYIKSASGSCEAIEPVTVTIHTSPVLSITNPASVCSPSTVDITDPAIIVGSTDLGTMTYYESDGVTVVGDPTAISTSGIYYIKTTTIDGCSDIQQVEVTISATPVLVITDPAAVCSPLTVDLTDPSIIAGSTNLGTMTYYEADGVTEITDPTVISVSGTYYIKSASGSCEAIEPVTVTIHTSPVLSITNPASVCSPSTVDITDPAIIVGSTDLGTMTYYESDGVTVVGDPTAISTSGIYYIKTTTIDGCSDIQQVEVTISATPVLVITDPAAVCAPNTVDITDPSIIAGSTDLGTMTYYEADGVTEITDPTVISVSGTYYIKSASGSCEVIEPVTVRINTSPTFTSVTNAGAICEGETAEFYLEGTVGATVEYTTDGGVTTVQVLLDAVAGQATVQVPNASSNVTLTVINIDNGCTVTVDQSSVVTVNLLPTVTNVTNNGPICEDGSGQFTIRGTANSTVAYTLNGVNATVDTNASGVAIVPVSNVTVNQTLQLVSIENNTTTCFANVSNNSTLVVNPLPTASFTAQNASVCDNKPVKIDFTGTPNATVTITDGTTEYDIVLDATGNFMNWSSPNLTENTTFTLVSVTSEEGCIEDSIVLSETITIADTPKIENLLVSDICDGEMLNISFDLIDADNYNWTITLQNADGSSFVFSGDNTVDFNQVINLQNAYQVGIVDFSVTPTSTMYSCEGTTVNVGGANPDLPAIQVNPVPQIDGGITAPDEICTGETIVASANSTFVGLSGLMYQWSADLVGVSTTGIVSGTIGPNDEVSLPVVVTDPNQQGSVVFHFTPFVVGAESCAGPEITKTVLVNPVPVSILLSSNAVFEICSGDAIATSGFHINLPSNAVSGTIVHWQAQDIYNVTGADVTVEYQTSTLPADITDILETINSDEQGYVIYKFWTTLGDCPGEFQYLRVNVNPLPEPVLQDSALCVEQIGGTVFQITHLNAGDFTGGNYQFRWYKVDATGDILIATVNNDSSIEIDEPGDYYVVVSNLTTSCTSVSNTVTVYETVPANTITTTVTDAFSDNATIVVTINGGSNGTYLYQLDEGGLQESNVFSGVSAGEHVVTVVDTQGCTFLQETVMVIDYPKYFTPNGDGINDTWNISGLDQNTTKLYIFDRYGKLIKQITPGTRGWDGTYNGHQLQSTDYWFSLQYEENGVAKEFRAHFSLKR